MIELHTVPAELSCHIIDKLAKVVGPENLIDAATEAIHSKSLDLVPADIIGGEGFIVLDKDLFTACQSMLDKVKPNTPFLNGVNVPIVKSIIKSLFSPII
jgi:hypothetical protein